MCIWVAVLAGLGDDDHGHGHGHGHGCDSDRDDSTHDGHGCDSDRDDIAHDGRGCSDCEGVPIDVGDMEGVVDIEGVNGGKEQDGVEVGDMEVGIGIEDIDDVSMYSAMSKTSRQSLHRLDPQAQFLQSPDPSSLPVSPLTWSSHASRSNRSKSWSASALGGGRPVGREDLG